MPNQHRFRKNGAESTGLCEPDHRNYQVNQKDQEVPHPANPTNLQVLHFEPLQEFAMDRMRS
jgi:hypothetical protein